MGKTQHSDSFTDTIERRLFDDRQVHLYGNVDLSQAYIAAKSLRFLALINKKPIKVYINTMGGNVLDGLTIYDTIKYVAKKMPVETIATGVCMSMGVIILQAGTRRYSMPNTRFLIHELHTVRSGTVSEMKDQMTEAEELQNLLDEILSKRAKINVEKLRKMISRKDCYLSVGDALKYNLIDKVIEG
jgi:ATP-dependent Clp protease, protease subunit